MEISPKQLTEMLWNGAGGILLQEAAIRLVSRHGYWLRNVNFRRYIEFDPDGSAGINWKEALAALDRNEFEADEEEVAILKLAASIATGYKVSIGWLVETLSIESATTFAESVMYADGLEAEVVVKQQNP